MADAQETLSADERLEDTVSLASLSSIVDSSIVDTSSETEDCDDSEDYTNISELPLYNQILNSNLSKQLDQITPLPTYNNVSVTNSTNVVFGNVIKVKGVLNINLYKEDQIENKENHENNNTAYKSGKSFAYNESSNDHICRIIPRRSWLAMKPPDNLEYIKEPVDMVIISHTDTETSDKSETNMGILRNIQTFHIDLGWDDIGYNFLIGCDGNVYEGRGWCIVGAHTYGFNRKSLGIAFIGNFMRSLPKPEALQACKKLLKRGIEEGHLSAGYKLLAHRQCIATISPGRLLFEEIAKWENFHKDDIQV